MTEVYAMMSVIQITNSAFTSNTYIIQSSSSERVWLVDIVDTQKVLSVLEPGQIVSGVFITHGHYDHIYDINSLITAFPGCKVYVSDYGKSSLYCEKTNLSYYHNDPIIFSGSNVVILSDGQALFLYDDCPIEVFHTPGHNPGSLTYKAGSYLFTGDSFIPGVKVVTKLKGGDRKDNITSLEKIHGLITKDTIVCPGHGPSGRLMDFLQ